MTSNQMPSNLNPSEAGSLSISGMSEVNLKRLADAQGMPIASSDLAQVLRHYHLLAEHAKNVLGFPLDEAVEMAGQYRP